MTLRYTSILPLLAVAATVHAQRPQIQIQPVLSHWEEAELPWGQNKASRDGMAKAGGDVLFYENFANGLAGNTPLGAWSTTGPHGSTWLYDTDGPNGDFSSTAERIQSASVANGFMIFDSNLANNGCVNTNSCVTWDGYLVSPVMNLSATPYAHLEWTQRLRWCCSGASGHFVDVSTDGGATWPNRIEAIRDQYVNLDPGTYTMRVNLHSFIASNPGNVRIRWAHEGSATGNLSHYHWQIDDVYVYESYDNDVGLVDPRIANFVVFDSFTDVLPYTIYPYSQLRPLSLGSPVRNEGSNVANNVALNLQVLDPTNAPVFNGNPSVASLAQAVVTNNLRSDFTPAAVEGEFKVNYNLSMSVPDERMVDNTAERRFRVSPSIYAYDNNARDNAYDRAQSGGQWPEYHAGNLYWIENTATAHGVQIALARAAGATPGTQVGAAFDGVIYRFDTDPPQIVGETDIVAVQNTAELTPTGQAIFYDLDLLAPIQLEAGIEYAVCVRTYGGDLRTRVATSGFSLPVSSIVYHPNVTTWFYLNFIPMVRLRMAPSGVSVEEMDMTPGFGLGQNMPNPTNDVTSIPYLLERSGTVSFQMHDLSGKLVMENFIGTQGAGDYRMDIDTGALPQGMYTYTLTVDGARSTKRMAVVR